MKRCTKCVLPENYPGISFNDEGTCNYCIDWKEKKYLGTKVLKQKINEHLNKYKERNKKYDCIVALSGGRDSSYLLYHCVKKLGLKVHAYSADNGFIPEQTITNMKNMTEILNVPLTMEKHDYLKKCFTHHIKAWMHKPSSPMIGMLCTGCKYYIGVGLVNFAKNNKIPVIVTGGTDFEAGGYKSRIMQINPNKKSKTSFVLGYLSNIIRNPIWILNPNCLIIQIKEYYFHQNRAIWKRNKDIKLIEGFWYMRWIENEVISTIENELNWRKNPNYDSTWRGDCDVAIIKLYLYKKMIGFNDKDDGLSCLIRDHQISRDEALLRIENEGEVSEETVKEIFNRLGLNYSDLTRALEKATK
jgi:hypothetical protein